MVNSSEERHSKILQYGMVLDLDEIGTVKYKNMDINMFIRINNFGDNGIKLMS